jgi:regulator of sigma E protease
LEVILYIVITALVISFLAFIHELGHFLVARSFGVPILEFAIGMGPTLFSWKGKTGTKYAVRALPIGGFVSMEGEEGTSENPKAYNNLNPWKKIAVTVAGPLVNIVFAVLVMFVLVLCTDPGSTTIGGFVDGAVTDGKLQVLDEIVAVGDVRVHTGEEVMYEIMMQGESALDITVKRDGVTKVIEDVVFNTREEQGIVLGEPDFRLLYLSATKDVTVLDYLYQALYRSINMVKMVFDSLWGLITGRFGMDAVSGPVGIVETVGQVAKVSVASLVNLIVMISMNLGIFNLLPIPALDGGRIVFHLIDGIAGKKVIKKEIEDNIIAITMMLLLGLMLIISVKDVINLF